MKGTEIRYCASCHGEFIFHLCYQKRGPGHGRFCSAACAKVREHHPRWKGGSRLTHAGYVDIRVDGYHPRKRHGYVFEHILIAERALGRFIEPPIEIHHFDENPANNTPSNLVICENKAYHKLLHARARRARKDAHE